MVGRRLEARTPRGEQRCRTDCSALAFRGARCPAPVRSRLWRLVRSRWRCSSWGPVKLVRLTGPRRLGTSRQGRGSAHGTNRSTREAARQAACRSSRTSSRRGPVPDGHQRRRHPGRGLPDAGLGWRVHAAARGRRTPAGSRTHHRSSVRPRSSSEPATPPSTALPGWHASGLRPGGRPGGDGLLLPGARDRRRGDRGSQITLDDATGLLLRMCPPRATWTRSRWTPTWPSMPARSPPRSRRTCAAPRTRSTADGYSAAADRHGQRPAGRGWRAPARGHPARPLTGRDRGAAGCRRRCSARVLPKSAQGSAPPVYVLLNPIPFEEVDDNSDLSLASEEGTRKLIDQVSAQVATHPGPGRHRHQGRRRR